MSFQIRIPLHYFHQKVAFELEEVLKLSYKRFFGGGCLKDIVQSIIGLEKSE